MPDDKEDAPRKHQKPVSLAPLDPDEAVTNLLKVKPAEKETEREKRSVRGAAGKASRRQP